MKLDDHTIIFTRPDNYDIELNFVVGELNYKLICEWRDWLIDNFGNEEIWTRVFDQTLMLTALNVFNSYKLTTTSFLRNETTFSNCKVIFYFANDMDAMRFKLVWG